MTWWPTITAGRWRTGGETAGLQRPPGGAALGVGEQVGDRVGDCDQGVGQVDAERFAADREPGGLERCL